MYKLFIFLIALVLSLFELSLALFFDKSLDSNILILTCIMILPGLFTLLERDRTEFITIIHGRISTKIRRRKLSFFLLNKISLYAMIGAGIGTIYIGLFYFIGNTEAITITTYTILILLAINIVSSLTESLFTNS